MKRIALNALAVALMLGFASLGRWQLAREQWKRAQLAEAAAALVAAPRPLAEALHADGDVALRVAGDGRFESAPVLWLDNQRRGERVGVRQYCLARVAGNVLLVDLGWLPLAGDRTLPTQACPQGTHELAGLLVPPPAAGLALGPALVEQSPGRWLATRIEPPAVAAAWREPALSAKVLRLDPRLPFGHERDLELFTNTLPPEKHRGYAFQWLGLAVTTLVIALVLNLRRRP